MAGASKTFVVTFLAKGGWGHGGKDEKVRSPHGRGDRVRWRNDMAGQRTLKFTLWPFVGKQRTIKVAAHGITSSLTIKPTATKKTYRYAVNPKVRKKGPPDGPAVVVNGE
jgi:hypothetical protein